MVQTFNVANIEEKQIKFGSMLVALIIVSGLLPSAINQFISLPVRTGILVMIVIWALYLEYLVKYHIHLTNIKRFGFILLISAYVVISSMQSSGHVKTLLPQIIEYCILGYFIGGVRFNSEYVSRYCCIFILVLLIPIIMLMSKDLNNTAVQIIDLGLARIIIPLAFVALAHFFFYRQLSNILLCISYIVSLTIILYSFIRGTRSTFLCVMMFIFLLLVNREKNRRKEKSAKQIIVIILASILILNFDTLMSFANYLFRNSNISFYFLTKSTRLLEQGGDLSNGRTILYNLAWKGFLEKPLLGHGVGAFGDMYPSLATYPHNYFLQALFEGGLLMGLPIITISLKVLIDLIFGRIENNDIRNLCIPLVSSTVTLALVSGDMWSFTLLWTIFGIYLEYSNVYNNGLKHVKVL